MGIKDRLNNLSDASKETVNEWVEARRDSRKKKKIDEKVIQLIQQGKDEEAYEELVEVYGKGEAGLKFNNFKEMAVERSEGQYQEFKYNKEGKSEPTSEVRNAKDLYPEGFWNPYEKIKRSFKINLGKFFFVMFAIAASLVLPFIFKESGSAWFLSFAVTTWAVATLFPSRLGEGEERTALLIFKASLNGMAAIFLSLGLIAISPTTPFMRLLTLVVFTIAYLSFPTSGGDDKYNAYLASWRMILGFYFVFFFIFAFMNVLSVSPLIFVSLALLAFAFYFNFPEIEGAAKLAKGINIRLNMAEGGTGGLMMWGVMMMLFGASMALFLGNMKFLFFGTYTWATLFYFGGILMLLMSSAGGGTGEAVAFSAFASIGLALGAFDLWMEKHYFAAMGYNMLVGLSVATGAASQQARPIIGVTALSFAVIILSSAYPAVLGEAVFGQWWPSVESGVTTLVGPIASTTEQMQESFQNAFLMFSCPSCYYEKQLQQQQANADVKSGGTVKGLEVSDFTFQVVNIPEQPLLATATLENKGEFTASNIQAKLKTLQTKSKKGTYTTQDDVTREFVTCSGTTPSGTDKGTCAWKDASYSGDMKLITFRYGAGSKGWAALGSCSCYTSDGKQKGYCQPSEGDATGCRKCKTIDRTWTEAARQTSGVLAGDSTSYTCEISGSASGGRDTVGYDYGGSFVAVGFDYSFDYIVNVSLDLQLIQPQTLNDLLLKKQITLRETRADFSGGPVQASIWTQKQPVRAGEDTLAVISLKNSGTGTVKISTPTICEQAGGTCRVRGSETLKIGNCISGEKEIEAMNCAQNTLETHCCVPLSYTSIGGKASNYILTIPFISGIKPKITEISKGGLDCEDVNTVMDGTTLDKYNALFVKDGKPVSVLGRIDKGDSFELRCKLTNDLGKAAIARYAFLFNYDIPKDIDRKSVIFVGNANYQYQNSKTMETQITWAPPQ